jgi:hypothetical protein
MTAMSSNFWGDWDRMIQYLNTFYKKKVFQQFCAVLSRSPIKVKHELPYFVS